MEFANFIIEEAVEFTHQEPLDFIKQEIIDENNKNNTEEFFRHDKVTTNNTIFENNIKIEDPLEIDSTLVPVEMICEFENHYTKPTAAIGTAIAARETIKRHFTPMATATMVKKSKELDEIFKDTQLPKLPTLPPAAKRKHKLPVKAPGYKLPPKASKKALSTLISEIPVQDIEPKNKEISRVAEKTISNIVLEPTNKISNVLPQNVEIKATTDVQTCAFLQFFSNDDAYILCCCYCKKCFNLWNWKKFVAHLESSHKSEMFYDKFSNKSSVEITTQKPKNIKILPKNEISKNKVKIIEKIKPGALQHKTPVTSSSKCNEKVATYSLAHENSAERGTIVRYKIKFQLHCDTNFEKFHYLQHLKTNSHVKLTDEYLKILHENLFSNVEEKIQNCLNFETTNPSRMFTFLKCLRKYALLWLLRHYGPKTWDSKAEMFLKDFDAHLSMNDLCVSLENARSWFKDYESTKTKKALDSRAKYFDLLTEIVRISNLYTFDCVKCDEHFFEANDLFTHEVKEHKIDHFPYKCLICGVYFSSNVAKEKHFELHLEEGQHAAIPCETCKRIFYNSGSFKKHLDTKHNQSINKDFFTNLT